MPNQQIRENLHFDSTKDKLILTIKQGKSFIFENVLDSACEKCKNPQDELYNAIQKQNNRYFINKPLQICADIESNKCDEESKESKRKTIHIQDELSFKNCVFSGNVFFNHAKFYKYADFHESIFNGVVSFYNAEFKYAPNFSTCVFQNLQATNFINVKIDDIDFDKVKQFIKEYRIDRTYQNKLNSLKQQYSQDTNEYKTQKQTLDNTHKIRYASNARDSFRTIKNVLIANNNLLDASSWHKLELYAKEHEIDLKAPTKFSKEWIERIQLCFYRHTSAHHTDLLKILSWFVVLVGGFATALFATKNLCNVGEIFSLIVFIVLTIATYKKDFFGIWTFINVIFFLALLAWNPKYIFGVANLFGNDKCQSDWFLNLILSLYSIAFILVIFSLQKPRVKIP